MQWVVGAQQTNFPLNGCTEKAGAIIFVIGWSHSFAIREQQILPGQFNAFHWDDHLPFNDTSGEHKTSPLLVLCSKEELAPWSPLCPRLAAFIQRADPLLARPAFMGLDMQGLIKTLLAFKGDAALAKMHGEGILRQWVSLLCIQLNLISDLPALPAHTFAAAMEAKRIVLADFEIMHTVEQLAKLTGTTEAGLQAAFKHLFGTTVAQFSRQSRLEEAHRILSTTTYPLRVVCLMVGYPDASNFSVAFKNQYGYWPGRIQQEKRKGGNFLQ